MIAFFKPLERAMERILQARGGTIRSPQIFVIGLPRSGTTLVYQVLVARLELAYLTAGAQERPEFPAWEAARTRLRHGAPAIDFQSRYGISGGAADPHEGGAFWARFFELEPATGHDQTLPRERELALRCAVRGVQAAFGGRPFINKNVLHLQHLEALAQAFPDAYFVAVERELPAVALSMHRARFEVLDNPTEWLSIRPPGWEERRGLSIDRQIAWQAVASRALLENGLSALAPERVLRLPYAEVCAAPESIVAALAERSGALIRPGPSLAPFKASPARPQSPAEEALLETLERVGGSA